LVAKCPVGSARPRLIVVCGSVSDQGRLADAALAARTIDHDLVYIPRAGDGLTRAEHDREHRAWIDRADEVIAVRKPDGSVGESTTAEVEYALSRGKPVRWWPPETAE
jgi:nucleoside 2-deoxyribosyltransferase